MKVQPIEKELRDFALSYPGAYEEFPWGERAFKVKGKVFVFMSKGAEEFSMSVKLPRSRDMAFDLPFAEPTHYGLGKHGWITAHQKGTTKLPVALLEAWVDESYRAVAPKRLVAVLDGGGGETKKKRGTARDPSTPPRKARRRSG
ncbi:MAG TPA: MmcQ/YjbR family DNA-binding protein [Thermoanaerobaculia bacterium]